MAELIIHLRERAAKLGCDGVVLGGVTHAADVVTSALADVNSSKEGHHRDLHRVLAARGRRTPEHAAAGGSAADRASASTGGVPDHVPAYCAIGSTRGWSSARGSVASRRPRAPTIHRGVSRTRAYAL